MRVISQNNSIDVAYEKATFYISETPRKDYEIIAQLDNGKEWNMAIYAFEYLAKEAMTDLRNAQFTFQVYHGAGGMQIETNKIDALYYKFKTNDEYLSEIKKLIQS